MCTSTQTGINVKHSSHRTHGKQIQSGQAGVRVCRYVLDTSFLGHSIEAYSSNCTSKSCLHIHKRKQAGLSVCLRRTCRMKRIEGRGHSPEAHREKSKRTELGQGIRDLEPLRDHPYKPLKTKHVQVSKKPTCLLTSNSKPAPEPSGELTLLSKRASGFTLFREKHMDAYRMEHRMEWCSTSG